MSASRPATDPESPAVDVQALGCLNSLAGPARGVAILSPLVLIPSVDDVPGAARGLFPLSVGLLMVLGLVRSDAGRHLPRYGRAIHQFALAGPLVGVIVFAHGSAGEWLVAQWLGRPGLTGWAGGLLLAGLTVLAALMAPQDLGLATMLWPQPRSGARFGRSGCVVVATVLLLPVQLVRAVCCAGALPLFLAGVAAPRPELVHAALVVILAELVIALTVRWWLNDFGPVMLHSATMAKKWASLGDALVESWVQDRLIARIHGTHRSEGSGAPDYTLLILLAAHATAAPDTRTGRRNAPGYLRLCDSMLLAAEAAFRAEPGIGEERREELWRLHLAARGTVSFSFAAVADGEGAVEDAVARSAAAVEDLEAAGYADFAAVARFQWAGRLRNDYLAVRDVLRPLTEDGRGAAWMSPFAHRYLANAARSGAPERVAFHEQAEAAEMLASKGSIQWRAEGQGWFPRAVVPAVPDAGVRRFERMSWRVHQQWFESGELNRSWTRAPGTGSGEASGAVDRPGLNVDGINYYGESVASIGTAWKMVWHAQLLAPVGRFRTARWLLERARKKSSDIALQVEALELLASIDEEEKDWPAAYARWSELVRMEESRRGRIADGDRRIDYQASHYNRLILLLTGPERGYIPGLPAPQWAVAFDHSERDRSRVLLELLRPGRMTAGGSSATVDYAELTAVLREFERRGGQRGLLVSFYVFHARVVVFLVRSGTSSPVVEERELPPDLTLPDALNSFGRMTSAAAFDQERLDTDFGALVETVTRHSEPGEPVCLVPHGVLHEVPLHAVATGGVPLAVRNPVQVVQSASLLADLYRDTAPPAPRGLCVFADSRSDQPLVHARAEARSMAGAFGERAEVLSGDRVTRRTVLDRLVHSEATAVHFACHGVLAPDDIAGSAISCADGPLTMDDLLGLRIRADLVTLSACRSGESRGRPGDERLGLARAFLIAGAKSVLVTQWQVDDLSTALFMERFYDLLVAGAPRGRALHEARATVRGMTTDAAVRWCEDALARADARADARIDAQVNAWTDAQADARTDVQADDAHVRDHDEAGAAERAAYEAALLRLICESGDLAAAKRRFARLKERTPSGSPERRELMVLWSRLLASAEARGGVGHGARRPFEHPYFWAPFVLVGDAR
ncbi:CHAT domain-containing protein [Streptomyces sp. NPDC051662]|uniref:CHAT domain-containing protein n=1 Tax=Streptomyces sp. NPDC051662 TaxID=3154750 RepID=UPI00342064D7